MTLVSSPKTITRFAKNVCWVPPPPHEDSTASVATAPAKTAARIRPFTFNFIQNSENAGRRKRSSCRGTPQSVAHTVPGGIWRRFLDPNKLHALGIESTQHGEQFMRRLVRPRRHAPMAKAAA